MLAVGVYYSIYKGWLHLSLQGFGLVGAAMVILVIFFVVYGMIRGFGMEKSTAIPLGYAMLYTSLWAVSPNIFDTFADRMPIINGILLILFIASIFKLVAGFFRHSKNPIAAIRELKTTKPETIETPQQIENEKQVDKEIHDEKKENKLVKKHAIKITKTEIHTIEDIRNILQQMVRLIKQKGNSVDQNEVAQLTYNLRQIYAKEEIMRKGLALLQRHTKAYNAIHKKNIEAEVDRLKTTQDKTQRGIIEEEIHYQRQMLQVLDFLRTNEAKIQEFTQKFNKLIYDAMTKVKSNYPRDALSYLNHANGRLNQMRKIFDRQKHFEKYLLSVNKKTIADLKEEKK